MGHANFCPQCGEITGGWDYEETTPCKCEREGLLANSGTFYESCMEDRIEELEAQVGRLQTGIRRLVHTYAWDIEDWNHLSEEDWESLGFTLSDLDPL